MYIMWYKFIVMNHLLLTTVEKFFFHRVTNYEAVRCKGNDTQYRLDITTD